MKRSLKILFLVILLLTIVACAPTETPRQVDPFYEMKPIPGMNILDILDPIKSNLHPENSIFSGYPHPLFEGVDEAKGSFVVWGEFPCSRSGGEGGQGCPQTIVFGDPNGLPISGCVLGFDERFVINPNYDSTNPQSKAILPRYFANGDENSCLGGSSFTQPAPNQSHSCALEGKSICFENSCEDIIINGVIIGFNCIKSP